MSLQQNVQSKSSANGFGRRRIERELESRLEFKAPSGKSNQARARNTVTGGKGASYLSPSRDRIVFLSTCLIGHPVEVQLKNGSVYVGTCYTTNIENDFAIILKMARMIKEVSFQSQKSESVSKAPSRTLIIPGKEIVQVIAKDANVTFDGLPNEFQRSRQQDLMIDSYISKYRQVEVERELAPWIPDEDDPKCPELENIFDNPWNRGWDQFETNEALFGVKSTFDEELYTTKLERGPWMRQIEREAIKIAREIEGEDTEDLHLAEERNMQLHNSFDVDEETRYSSVYRGSGIDDGGDDEVDDVVLDVRNSEAVLIGSTSTKKTKDDLCDKKTDTARGSSNLAEDDGPCSHLSDGSDLDYPDSYDHGEKVIGDAQYESCSSGNELRAIDCFLKENSDNVVNKDYSEEQRNSQAKASTCLLLPELESPKLSDEKMDLSDKAGPLTNASDNTSHVKVSAKVPELENRQIETKEIFVPAVSSKVSAEITSSRTGRPSSSASSNSDQEFKLNPNARSFTPSRSATRALVTLPDNSLYYPANVSPLSQMHGMPMGIGVGPSFPGHQPVIYNHSAPPLQTPPAYFHPGGAQYGQQMIVSHPRQVLYMPANFQPELPYKGRDF